MVEQVAHDRPEASSIESRRHVLSLVESNVDDPHGEPSFHPSPSRSQRALQELAGKAGIALNGDRPWDIRVHDDHFYGRVLRDGSLGLGESYMDGWWDADRLDETFYRIHRSGIRHEFHNWKTLLPLVSALLINKARPSKAYEVGRKHYDLGNDLYRVMLDRRMVYTCGYWKEAETLDAAQEAKLDLVCRKIGLKAGDRVLDVGCGWGSFLQFAAERYGARGVGITVSEEQTRLARMRLAGQPVEIRLLDYRAFDEQEQFDHVVSLGMFEHVGYKNYRTFMRFVNRQLKDGGLFLLHTIGSDYTAHGTDPWYGKYIFPNSMLPSIRQVGHAIEGLFVMEDWHNFSAHYDRTLMAWYENVSRAWDSLPAHYDDRFRRMWSYYLLSCAGMFRARGAQLWQIVLSKGGVPGGYLPIH